MFSSDDRRRLEQIEQRMRQEDPRLARALGAWPDRPRRFPPTAVTIAVIVLSVIGGLVGLVLLGPGIVVLAVLVLLAAGWLSHRSTRRRRTSG